MSWNSKKKDNQRVLAVDIYKQIAKSTKNLTIAQVRECFQIYYKLLTGIIESDYKNENMQFYLPSIGYFYFVRRKGTKKGRKYKIQNIHTGELDIFEKQDEGIDYEILKFKINQSIKDKVKELSKKKYENKT